MQGFHHLKKGDMVWVLKKWNASWWLIEKCPVSYIDVDGSIRVKDIPFSPDDGVSIVGVDRKNSSFLLLPHQAPAYLVMGSEKFVKLSDVRAARHLNSQVRSA